MKVIFSFSRRKNYLLHNNIVQQIQYFDANILSRGYSTKFQAVGGYDTHPLQCKMEIPAVGGGGGGGSSNLKVPSVGGMDIFWNFTIIDVFSILLTASVHTCQLSRIK